MRQSDYLEIYSIFSKFPNFPTISIPTIMKVSIPAISPLPFSLQIPPFPKINPLRTKVSCLGLETGSVRARILPGPTSTKPEVQSLSAANCLNLKYVIYRVSQKKMTHSSTEHVAVTHGEAVGTARKGLKAGLEVGEESGECCWGPVDTTQGLFVLSLQRFHEWHRYVLHCSGTSFLTHMVVQAEKGQK